MNLDRVYSELDWFSKNKIEFIFCCDANFGMLPRDFEIALKAAENKKKYGYPMFCQYKIQKMHESELIRYKSYWQTQA